MLYGRSATGKTTLAATFPKPALLMDVKDSGDDSVSGVDGLKVLDVKSWDDFELYYWWLHRYRHKLEWKTLIIDTATQLQQLAILKILRQRNGGEEKKVKGRTVVSPTDWGVMTKQGWGDVSSLMKMWITNVRDLPMETVFVAQDRTFNFGDEEDDGLLDPEVGPALSPSIAKHLNASVHFIGNTFIRRRSVTKKIRDEKGKLKHKEVQKTEYCLRIGPNPVYITKIRKPREQTSPVLLVDPSYGELIKIIQGGK